MGTSGTGGGGMMRERAGSYFRLWGQEGTVNRGLKEVRREPRALGRGKGRYQAFDEGACFTCLWAVEGRSGRRDVP